MKVRLVLLPDEGSAQKLVDLGNQLTQDQTATFRLDDTHLPHVTLVAFEATELDPIKAKLEQYVHSIPIIKTQGANIETDETGYIPSF